MRAARRQKRMIMMGETKTVTATFSSMPALIGRLLYITSSECAYDAIAGRFKVFGCAGDKVEIYATDGYRLTRVVAPVDLAARWGLAVDSVYDFVIYGGTVEEIYGTPLFYVDATEPAYLEYEKLQRRSTGMLSDRIGKFQHGDQVVLDVPTEIGFACKYMPNAHTYDEPSWNIHTLENGMQKPSILFRATLSDSVVVDYILAQCVDIEKVGK